MIRKISFAGRTKAVHPKSSPITMKMAHKPRVNIERKQYQFPSRWKRLKSLVKSRVIIEHFHHKKMCNMKFPVLSQKSMSIQIPAYGRNDQKESLCGGCPTLPCRNGRQKSGGEQPARGLTFRALLAAGNIVEIDRLVSSSLF
jgi:hypothetical protein